MWTIVKLTVRFSSFVMLLNSALVAAQQPTAVPSAPVPAQIAAARKVFIANAPGESAPYRDFGDYGPYHAYDEFYAGVKKLGRFELGTSPSDSDLVIEICFTDPVGPVSQGTGTPDPQFNLTIVDPKTQVPLWWFTEHIQKANGAKASQKKYEAAMSALLEDLRKLATQPSVPADSH